MKITSMEVFPIRIALTDPIPMSSGVISSTGNVLVKLAADDGNVGWGEGVEAPSLTGHRQADIVGHLRSLEALVLGADPRRVNELWARIHATLPEASTALGAIDIAIHDLVGKSYGVPAHALIGGMTRERVPALTLVGSGDTDADLAKLESLLEAGFGWFKIKLGIGPAEVERRTLEKAVELAGPESMLCADANGAWGEGYAESFLQSLAGLPLRFLEQPVAGADRLGLLRLAKVSPVPLCADESATTLGAIMDFAGTAIGGVSVKLIKHGGITGVMRAGGICSVAGLEINLAGKVIESSVSAAANLHCAAALHRIDYGCSPANRGLVLDVTEDPIRPESGEFAVPSSPGLGVQVDETMVARLSS